MQTEPAEAIDVDLLLRIVRLNTQYARAIDDDRLEQWPEFFREDGRYAILPRENAKAGYPVALISCDGAAMMRDRVVAVRRANVFGPHTYRHVVGIPDIIERSGSMIRTATNVAVFQTALDPINYGRTLVYAVGEYRDLIDASSHCTFTERVVVLDTAKIPTMLATPL